eukprot:scaffold20881_cov121-Isochrysis_galbana.AAC.2
MAQLVGRSAPRVALSVRAKRGMRLTSLLNSSISSRSCCSFRVAATSFPRLAGSLWGLSKKSPGRGVPPSSPSAMPESPAALPPASPTVPLPAAVLLSVVMDPSTQAVAPAPSA